MEQPDDDGEFITLHEALPFMAGFRMPVALATRLHDRLEVPEDWQWADSFDQRAMRLLHSIRAELGKHSTPQEKLSVSVTLPNNMTGIPEAIPLLCRFEDGALIVYYPEDD